MITKVTKQDGYTYYGLSTDTKPINQPNGSIWIEIDTSKVYFWNEEGNKWEEFV